MSGRLSFVVMLQQADPSKQHQFAHIDLVDSYLSRTSSTHPSKFDPALLQQAFEKLGTAYVTQTSTDLLLKKISDISQDMADCSAANERAEAVLAKRITHLQNARDEVLEICPRVVNKQREIQEKMLESEHLGSDIVTLRTQHEQLCSKTDPLIVRFFNAERNCFSAS